MYEHASSLLGVTDTHNATVHTDFTAVANLTTGFCIKRRLVQDDLHIRACTGLGHLGTVNDQRHDLTLCGLGLIAKEIGGTGLIGNIEPDRAIRAFTRARPGGARLGLLLGHRAVKAVGVNSAALFAQRILCQIKRKAVCVVEFERSLTWQRRALIKVCQFIVQQFQTAIQRLFEARFFLQQRLFDHRLRPTQLRIGCAHLLNQRRHKAMHDRILGAKKMRVAHRPAHDAAQHVAAAIIGRHHTIRDQERGRPQVICDDPVMDVLVAIRIDIGHVSRGFDQRLEQVGVVVVMAALQQCANPLQPHAGVDRLHVQRLHRAVFELLILHEHDVPDFDETVAVLIRAARRAAPDVITVVIKDLGAGTTGSGRPHLPEVVRGIDADDAIFRDTDLFPDLKGFVIGVVDGRQQL